MPKIISDYADVNIEVDVGRSPTAGMTHVQSIGCFGNRRAGAVGVWYFAINALLKIISQRFAIQIVREF